MELCLQVSVVLVDYLLIRGAFLMRGLTILGVVLLVGGIAALALGGFTFTDRETIIDAGPLQVTAEDKHRVNIPTIAGVIAALAGAGLIVAGLRGKA
jgi:hypothetical protein